VECHCHRTSQRLRSVCRAPLCALHAAHLWPVTAEGVIPYPFRAR
jgi:hypothetical protein